MVYSRFDISACAVASSKVGERRPRSKMGRSLMRMVTVAGSKATPARPAAASRRPQLGSALDQAVLQSGDVAMVAAMALASASVRAPVISSVTTWVTPSPSSMIWWASESQTRCSAASKAGTTSPWAAMPLVPLASSRTVSLVEVSPSMEMQLKLVSTAAVSMASRWSEQAAMSVKM